MLCASMHRYDSVVSEWTFLTNHGHVAVFLARQPDARIRDLAEAVGITERAAQRIVSELVDAGYLRRKRVGRRNTYQLVKGKPLRHPVEREHKFGELLEALGRTDS